MRDVPTNESPCKLLIGACDFYYSNLLIYTPKLMYTLTWPVIGI